MNYFHFRLLYGVLHKLFSRTMPSQVNQNKNSFNLDIHLKQKIKNSKALLKKQKKFRFSSLHYKSNHA